MPKAVRMQCLDSSAILNRVADVNLWWFSSWQIGKFVLNWFPLGSPLDMMSTYSSSQWGIVCKCAAQPCTQMHTPSFTMNRAFIYRPPDWGDAVATEMSSQRSSIPVTRDSSQRADVAMKHLISLPWRRRTRPWVLENHSWITQNLT